MIFEKPANENYCATVVEIKNLIELTGCDNIQGSTIFGNSIIISKNIKIGDVGIYFPAETQLSGQYVKENNLYRDNTKNIDINCKGYLDDNRRIRTMKMRGSQSCGLFMSLESLAYCIDKSKLKIGDTFDKINNVEICKKYKIPLQKEALPGTKKQRKSIKQSKIIEGQFRFHQDTNQFAKNIHKFSTRDIISITYKIHGTSVVISNVLCKKPLSIFYILLKKLGIKIIDYNYDNLYSSRKVIKNSNFDSAESYYDVDIWGLANHKIKNHLLNGMTIYAEVVGFLPNNKPIQQGYDYGCISGDHEIYIYRITYTNVSGDVFEFSSKQTDEWCKEHGLNYVPKLYYGRVGDIFKRDDNSFVNAYDENKTFHDNLLYILQKRYLEKDCFMCKNSVPAEGVVIRRECNYFDAYKLKSFKFLKRETENLDKKIIDIEEDN